MVSLKDKKILLICARFFGYEHEIQMRLKELGASVDFFDQRPSNSFLAKVLIRLNNKFLTNTINRYYSQIIKQTETTQYDYVVFISPEVITKDLFLQLKAAQKNAEFILYMWDSFNNKSKNIIDIVPFFDFRYSFDKIDCGKPAYDLRYRPLFFLNAYSKVSNEKGKEYDLLFIGTIHSDRYTILSKCGTPASVQKLTHFYYMFFPSKILYYLKRIVDPSLWKTRFSEFRFDALKKNEIIEYLEKSRVVIDIQHPSQIGLTMRTIEMIGARRKLITTNPDIVNYDFYNPNNICVIDRVNIKLDPGFFHTNMVPLDNAIYEKYSIDGWIKDLFSRV